MLFPLLAAYVLDRCEGRPLRRLLDRMEELEDGLRRDVPGWVEKR